MLRHQYLFAILVLSLLTACGGGDPEPEIDEQVPSPGPVRCQAFPGICR